MGFCSYGVWLWKVVVMLLCMLHCLPLGLSYKVLDRYSIGGSISECHPFLCPQADDDSSKPSLCWAIQELRAGRLTDGGEFMRSQGWLDEINATIVPLSHPAFCYDDIESRTFHEIECNPGLEDNLKTLEPFHNYILGIDDWRIYSNKVEYPKVPHSCWKVYGPRPCDDPSCRELNPNWDSHLDL